MTYLLDGSCYHSICISWFNKAGCDLIAIVSQVKRQREREREREKRKRERERQRVIGSDTERPMNKPVYNIIKIFKQKH